MGASSGSAVAMVSLAQRNVYEPPPAAGATQGVSRSRKSQDAGCARAVGEKKAKAMALSPTVPTVSMPTPEK